MSDGSELSVDISAYVFTEHSDYLEYLATDIDLPTEEEQDMTTTHQHQEDRMTCTAHSVTPVPEHDRRWKCG
jgi:hypothetical protein